MKKTKTQRGFSLIEFQDIGGNKCSLQKSSAVRDNGDQAVWLGCDDIGLKTFVPYGFNDPKRGESWKEHTEDDIKKAFGPNVESIIANTRMQLTQKQVKKLLPHLIKFAETGEI